MSKLCKPGVVMIYYLLGSLLTTHIGLKYIRIHRITHTKRGKQGSDNRGLLTYAASRLIGLVV